MKNFFLLFLCVVLAGCRSDTPGKLAPDAPSQSEETEREEFMHQDYRIVPLADFYIQARVLGVKTYRDPPISPMDFAVGWGDMSDPDIYSKLHISQSGRWYYYRWGAEGPPIAARDIITQSSNIHIIPSSDSIEDELEDVDAGDVVILEGLLVRVEHPKMRGAWTSSLKRNDSGDGACELMYVEKVHIF